MLSTVVTILFAMTLGYLNGMSADYSGTLYFTVYSASFGEKGIFDAKPRITFLPKYM